MQTIEDKVLTYRRQLQRVLDSAEFQTSRQMREFLAYAAEAAFQCRTHIDQTEIAERVLHRGAGFDPLYDPAVRKLATLTRQRLDSYYAGEGHHDPIVITIPLRSYVPQFVERVEVEQSPLVAHPTPDLIPPADRNGAPRLPKAMLAAVAIAAIACSAYYVFRHGNPDAAGVFRLTSVRGDIMHASNELPGSAIQVGPKIGLVDQVTVRMRFTSERATQQAGLLIFENADRYVKLGRQFLSRPQLEFGMETQAQYAKPPNTFGYDPEGQNGEPVWLSIRRNHDQFTAFVSSDGRIWQRFGNPLRMPDPMPNARVAIFAHNGRSDAPPAEARFDRLSIGPAFYESAEDISQMPGWRLASTCAQPLSVEPPALMLPLGTEPRGCSTDLLRPAPPGDWIVSTRLEFTGGSGAAAGLTCRGSKGRFRLIRWDVNGGSVSAEHLGHNQVNRPDFAGNPPLTLRITCRNGTIRGSFSRDDAHFEEVPLEVSLRDLGDKPEIGLHAAKGTWGSPSAPPAPRFSYIHQEIEHLSNYR